MILIAQRGHGPLNAQLVARLYQRGYRVRVASSVDEALEVLRSDPVKAVVVHDPDVPGKCPLTICGQLLRAEETAPPMLGLAEVRAPDQRARCEECMTLLEPGVPSAEIAGTVDALARGA